MSIESLEAKHRQMIEDATRRICQRDANEAKQRGEFERRLRELQNEQREYYTKHEREQADDRRLLDKCRRFVEA